MGFLNDLNLDDVATDPNRVPDGTYPAHVSKFKMQPTQSKGNFLVIGYTLAPGAKDAKGTSLEGKVIDEWKSANAGDEPSKKSWLKQRIVSLGVPESRVSAVEPEDVIGQAVLVTVKTKGEYQNVVGVKVDNGEFGPGISGTSDSVDSLAGAL